MLESVLKDHEEINKSLTIAQSRKRITNQDYFELNKLVSVLLLLRNQCNKLKEKIL